MSTLDTHTIIKELVHSGIKEKEAESLVSNFVSKSEFLTLEKDRLGLATKDDILILSKETKNDIQLLQSEIELLKSEIKTEQKWIKAAILGILGLLVKIAFFPNL